MSKVFGINQHKLFATKTTQIGKVNFGPAHHKFKRISTPLSPTPFDPEHISNIFVSAQKASIVDQCLCCFSDGQGI